jgi:hypothetical protein
MTCSLVDVLRLPLFWPRCVNQMILPPYDRTRTIRNVARARSGRLAVDVAGILSLRDRQVGARSSYLQTTRSIHLHPLQANAPAVAVDLRWSE